MNDREWTEALRRRARVSARWGYPHDLSDVRAEGRIVGYSAKPMVLVEQDNGEQVWWAAELTFPVEEAPEVGTGWSELRLHDTSAAREHEPGCKPGGACRWDCDRAAVTAARTHPHHTNPTEETS